MKINLVIPQWYPAMQGFNEIVQSELSAYIENSLGYSVNMTTQFPEKDSDIVIFIAQYREEARSDWLKEMSDVLEGSILVGVCGKATTEAAEFIIANMPNIDFVIKGEPEYTVRDIIAAYPDIVYSSIKGLVYRTSDNNIIYSGKRDAIQDYDSLPLPSFSYLKEGYKKYPLCVLRSSRGCHGKCNFCEGHIYRQSHYGNIYRAKSAERIINEIEYVINTFGYRVFAFADDNFLVDNKYGKIRAENFAQILLKKKIRIRYTIECRVDNIDENLFALLKKSGLQKVFLGIESGVQSVLDRIEKGTTVEQNDTAIKILKSLDIKCEPGYILFDPLTTVKELHENIKFFEKHMDSLYSLPAGNGEGKMYFPHGCEAIKSYFPNEDDMFYQKLENETIEYPFINTDVKIVHKKYIENLHQLSDMNNRNILLSRINCLKEALK